MKRFATLFATALVASVLAGCDGGGIQEGAGKEDGPATGITDGMRKTMQEQADKMKMKGTGRPANVPKGGAAPKEEPPKDEAAK